MRTATLDKMLTRSKEIFNSHSFSALLGLHSAKLVPQVQEMETTFRMKLGANPCVSKEKRLPVSSALAIIDELSTFGFMASDATSRAGVSVHLTAEIIRPIFVGDDISVRTDVTKIGRSLGFCECVIYAADEPSKVLARGKHIKFLQMGKFWDLIGGQRVFETLSHIGSPEPSLTKTIGTFLMQMVFGLKEMPTFDYAQDAIGLAFDKIGVKPKPGGGGGGMESPYEERHYSFTFGPHLQNPIGGIHGGCVGMACEHAAAMLLAELEGDSKEGKGASRKGKRGGSSATREEMTSGSNFAWVGTSLEARYLSVSRGECTIKARLVQRPSKNEAIVEGDLCDPKGHVCNQFTIRMSHIG